MSWIPDDSHLNQISGAILDASIHIHRTLGPGLHEKIYERALAHELRKRGHDVATQVPLRVVYDGVDLGVGYRADLIVDGLLVVELKVTQELHGVHFVQVRTYLRLAGCELGLLINFNVGALRDGFHRVVKGEAIPPMDSGSTSTALSL